MRTLLVVGVAFALAAGSAVAAPEAPCAPPRRAWIPPSLQTDSYTEHVPACLEERSVPVYEVTQEPVYGCRMVPHYGAVSVPVERFREEAVYETRRTPVCVPATVPVYAQRCKAVMGLDLTSWCEERVVPSYHISEQVQCGVRTERRLVGYKEEKVKVGSIRVACQSGWKVEQRLMGYVQEQFIVGTREVRRIASWKKEMVVVRPASTRLVFAAHQRPGRWVTVTEAQPRPLPVAGTSEVLTEAQYAAEVAAAAASSAQAR